jgi:CheY-like chemotaxis protein
MGSSQRPPPSSAEPFSTEPGTDLTKRIEELRAAGEALDAVLRDAKRFVQRSVRSPTRSVVLVVDDEREVRDLLVQGLSNYGFRVEEAADGAQAIEKASALRPDAIVMDFAMPGMNGGEAARRLAADETTRRIPIVLFSAFADRIPRDVRLGCAAFLAKPCTPDELGSLLHLIIAARATLR